MSIRMTIEVSPEQAVRIAEILGSDGTFHNAPTASPGAVQGVSAVPTAPSRVPVATPAAPAVPTAPPTAVKKYTADELSIASRPIVEAGRQQELLDLLHSFTFTDANGVTRNVQNIREMPEELFPAFANSIRQLGGRI